MGKGRKRGLAGPGRACGRRHSLACGVGKVLPVTRLRHKGRRGTRKEQGALGRKLPAEESVCEKLG